MTSAFLIDDGRLSAHLRGESLSLDGDVYTTGLWYVRLCQAVLTPGRAVGGQLSAPIARLPPTHRAAAMRALFSMPDDVGLLSLRELGPVIAELRARHQLNLLGIEALAAAATLDATVILSAPSPRLEDALTAEGLAWQRP